MDFFKKSDILLKNTPPDVISEIALRAHVGSKDIPSDKQLGKQLINYAAQLSADPSDKHLVKYFSTLMQKVTKNIDDEAKSKVD